MRLVFVSLTAFLVLSAFAQTDKWTLNSLSWQDYSTVTLSWTNAETEEYTYTDAGKVQTAVFKRWNVSLGAYQPKSKIESAYANGRVDSKVYSNFYAVSQTWVDSLKRSYVYDFEGRLSSVQISKFENGLWKPVTRETREYGASGNLTFLVFEEWVPVSQAWQNVEKEEYTYDVSNRILTYTGFVWDFLFDEWIYFDKEEYVYADEGKTVNYVYYEWDEWKAQWVYLFKDYSTYFNNNLNWGYLSYYWDAATLVWVDFTKEIHDLDAAGNVLRYAEYEWDTSTKKWDYYDKEEYVYDSFGNVTQFIDYNKNEPYNLWIENIKEVYTYNTAIEASMLLIPFDEPSINGVYFKSQLLGIVAYTWDASRSSWKNSSKGTFAYDKFVPLGDSPVHDTVPYVVFYPNPAADYLVVEADSSSTPLCLTLTNSHGVEEVGLLSGTPKVRIWVSNIKPGVYIVSVSSSNGKRMIGKLIKK